MNILIGFLLILVSIAPIMVWYFSYYKKRNMEKQCVAKTNGKVVRYSKILYNNVSLPVVEYIVNNNKYNVVGPKFKGFIVFRLPGTIGVKDKFETNLTSREELPEIVKFTVVGSSNSNYQTSPLMDLYPIDSMVDVYYDPSNPKIAYVQRYVSISKFSYSLILLLGILLIIIGLVIMSGIIVKF